MKELPLILSFWSIVVSIGACPFGPPGPLMMGPPAIDVCAGKPHGAYLPDPTSCQHYYHCTWGKAVRKDCGPGRVWDPRITNCNWAWAYHCVGSPGYNIVNSFCKGKANGNYPHPDFCKMYITCSNGIAHEMPCPAGLNWNHVTKGCDWPRNAPCDIPLTVTRFLNKVSELVSVEVTNQMIAAITQIVEGFYSGGCQKCLYCSEASFVKRMEAAKTPRDFVYARRLLGVMFRVLPSADRRMDGFLMRLRHSLGNSGFSALVGGGGANSLTFVLDTTGSMVPEKDAMISIVSQISAKAPSGTKYILSPFNDPGSCGRRSEKTPPLRIVNGEDAVPHSWPWQLSFRYKGSHICGASLLTPGWALTAAHCLTLSDDASDYTLVAGAHQRENDGQVFGISKIRKHKGFSMVHVRNDVALLKLSTYVQLSDKVGTICLPSQGDRAPAGSHCYISGWGRISSSDQHTLADKLQQSKVPLVNYTTCRSTNGATVDENSMICAGGAGSSACNGDSGGPLQCLENERWVLRGVASWVTAETCPGNTFSVYARVSSYSNWIESNRDGSHYLGPAVGPISVFTDTASLNTAVKALKIKYGGDCQEFTYHGIVGALQNPHLVPGSSIFVITDAPSQDATGEHSNTYRFDVAKELALRLGVHINFFFSTASEYCDPTTDKTFFDLKDATGGEDYLFTKNTVSISKAGGVVAKAIIGTTRLSSGSSSGIRRRRSADVLLRRNKRAINTALFKVDPRVEKLLVTARVGDAKQITLKTPSNAIVAGSSLLNGFFWEIETPPPGTWKLESTKIFNYTVLASSKKNIAFVPVFLKKLGCGSDVTLPRPLAGEEARALIALSDDSTLNLPSMAIHVMSTAGEVLTMATIADGVAKFTPPSRKFYLRLTVTTKVGVQLVRISKDLEAQSVVLVPKMTPSLFTVTPGVASPFNYILFNNAPSQTFNITAEPPLPSGTAVSPSPPSLTVPHNGNGEGVINITVPPGTAANTGVLLYVKAAGSGVTGDLVTTLVVNGGDVCS